MEMKLLNSVGLLFFLSCFITRGQGQACEYRYFEEPRINVSCNPYPNNELRTRCTVTTPSPESDSIEWFWQSSDEDEEIMLSNTTATEIRPSMSDFQGESQLILRNLASHTGMYWCRVRLVNGTLLEESNRLTLSDERVYTDQGFLNCVSPLAQSLFDQSNRCIFIDDTPSPNATSPPSPDILGPALYSVIAVIAIFCLVIVTLSVLIVLLYRRKCARVDFKTADGRASNPYSGFTKERQRVNGVANGISKDRPSSLTSSTNSTRPHLLSTTSPAPPRVLSSVSPQESTEEEPYSRLVRSHSATHSQHGSVALGYSKLIVGEDTPPPRPPKPASPQNSLMSSQQPRGSRIYSDLDDQDLEKVVSGEFPQQEVPHMSIYNTLEGPGHISSISNVRASHLDYDPVCLVARRGSERSGSKTSAIFDDPEYSPLKGNKKDKQFEVIDPRYVGNYERSPEYTCPTVKLSTGEVDPKYRGDYERDPNYIPKPPPRIAASNPGQHETPSKDSAPRRQSAESDVLAKYRGNYERNPNYVPPPLRAAEKDKSLLGRKYSGNYERDPVYMTNLLKKAREERASSAEYTQPRRTNSISKENGLVSPRGYVNVEQGSGKFFDSAVNAVEYLETSEPSHHSASMNTDKTVVSSHTTGYVNVEQGSGKFSDNAVLEAQHSEDNGPIQQGTFMDF